MPKLQMDDRADGAYSGNLDDYNEELTATDPKGPVKCSRHHVVDNKSIRVFWNLVIENNNHFELLKGFFDVLSISFEDYVKLDFAQPPSAAQPIRVEGWEKQVKAFEQLLSGFALPASDPASSQYRQNDSIGFPEDLEEAFSTFGLIFQWLPGNIFIGPKGPKGATQPYTRDDDPGQDFEQHAQNCMNNRPGDWFDSALSAKQAIARYEASDRSSPQAAELVKVVAKWLTETAALVAMSPMKAAAWDRGTDPQVANEYRRYWLKRN